MSARPELNIDDTGGFIKFFRKLPSKGDDTIRIFDHGDYYTAHGDDAGLIARTVRLKSSLTGRI
jgi:DNA mismatch repair protein MSH2